MLRSCGSWTRTCEKLCPKPDALSDGPGRATLEPIAGRLTSRSGASRPAAYRCTASCLPLHSSHSASMLDDLPHAHLRCTASGRSVGIEEFRCEVSCVVLILRCSSALVLPQVVKHLQVLRPRIPANVRRSFE